MSATVEYARKQPPARKRFNPRVLILGLVLALPVGWMVYTFVKLSVGSGIEQVGDYKEVVLKAMGNFAFDETSADVNQVPEVYRQLDGQKLLLVGEMYSDSAADYATEFQLVYSIQKCCFGGPPKVQERVFAKLPPGKKAPIYSGLVKVYGILHVKPELDNGRVISLYTLDVEKMEPYR